MEDGTIDFLEVYLKISNKLLSLALGLTLLITGLYAGYALWDNNQIHQAAENVQAEMLSLKPSFGFGEKEASFDELLAINPDVAAWVSLDNTSIDHPILQGETNLTYINKDVYGEFALAGSIFMDTRSDKKFRDPYSLLYGHDMIEGRMFGDLSLYKDKEFFEENSSGILILPDRSYTLKIYATLLAQASDDMIFDPDKHENGLSDLIEYTEKNALYLRSEMTENLKETANEGLQILSLTTCSGEFTDARTIILAVMQPSRLVE